MYYLATSQSVPHIHNAFPSMCNKYYLPYKKSIAREKFNPAYHCNGQFRGSEFVISAMVTP